MPSTVVHLAFAGMIAGALLGDVYDRRSVLVVFAVVAAADLDSFVGLITTAGHRTLFHTFLIPITAGVLLAVDFRRGADSFVRRRWGAWGVRVAWVSVLAYALSAIGLDLFSAGGANPFWPIHDQFYQVRGNLLLSNQRGIVQTFVDIQPADAGGPSGSGSSGGGTEALGSSEERHVSTGVDPQEGSEPRDVERIFPIARSGWQLLVLLVGTGVTVARFYVDQSVTGDR